MREPDLLQGKSGSVSRSEILEKFTFARMSERSSKATQPPEPGISTLRKQSVFALLQLNGEQAFQVLPNYIKSFALSLCRLCSLVGVLAKRFR